MGSLLIDCNDNLQLDVEHVGHKPRLCSAVHIIRSRPENLSDWDDHGTLLIVSCLVQKQTTTIPLL